MHPRNGTQITPFHALIGAVALLVLWYLTGCAAMHTTPYLSFLTVTPNATSLALGDTAQFKVVATYSDGTNEDVTASATWKTMDPGVATVDTGGMVSSVAQGTTFLFASKSGVSGAASLTVSKAALSSISITSPTSPIALGQSAQLRATGIYTDKSLQDITSLVIWTVAQPSVIVVNSAGLAVSKTVGNSGVTATLDGITASGQITVSPAALVSITVQSKGATVPLGESEQFSALGAYTDGSTADLTGVAGWTSSAPGVVAVNALGTAAARALGSAAISAAVGGITGTASLTVSSASLVSITVNASHPSLPLGSPGQLTATGTYSDGTTKDLTGSATWTSSSPGIVAIAGGGAITTKSVGTATVSASSSGITGNASLTVSSASLVSIAVNASHAFLPLGSVGQLTATGTYTDGTTKDLTGSATWTSSSPGIVAIASGGDVTTKSVGAAIVSASASSITGSAKLSVLQAALIGIGISSSSSTVPLGDTLQLTATGKFTDGSSQALAGSVSWTSSSPGVLSIGSSGIAAGVSVGSASVAAVSGGISGVVNLSVSGPVLSSLTLAPAGPTVPLGSSLQLAVTGTYSDGSKQDVTQQITWNIDTPSIAIITGGGMVSGMQVGTTGIEASMNGIQTSDTLTVQPLLTVAYFDATSGVDSVFRITNPGTTGQDLCAMVYIFDQDQQMSECCGCTVSQDGLLTLSLNKNLLNNPLTGVPSKSGTVMLVAADQASNASCNASGMTPAGTVLAWSTHLPQSKSGLMSSAEEPFSNSPLSATLSSALQAQCSFVQQLGSGQGLCSCGGGSH
jgi:hypothetical protein